MSKKLNNLGGVTVFGMTPETEQRICHKIQTCLGVTPQIVDFGTAGRLFFYTNQGDLVHNSQMIALKRGHVRDTNYSPLSTRQLVDQKILSPEQINVDAVRGNAQLICISLTRPLMRMYQTYMGLPQLFYTLNRDGSFIYASDFRVLLTLCDHVELDENMIPMFFLFRHVVGPHTYMRHIYRLFPGELLTWQAGAQKTCIVRPLDADPNYHSIERVTPETISQLYETMRAIMQAYVTDFSQQNLTTANLLSGGVDSSVIQVILNQVIDQRPLRTYTYMIETPSFQPEVEYAKEASEMLGTTHTFYRVTPDIYLDKLTQAIEVIARPQLNNECTPGKFALSQYLARDAALPDVYFDGQGADAIYGLGVARKLARYEMASHIPGAAPIMKLAARIMGLSHRRAAHALQEIADLMPPRDPHQGIDHPLNTIGILSDLDLMLRSFGESTLIATAQKRNELLRRYLTSTNLQENVHTVDLLSVAYEPSCIGEQFFTANGRRIFSFYLDEEIIRFVYAIKPQSRYLKARIIKPLLKHILVQQGYQRIATKPKKATIFTEDLFDWFQVGPLAERVRAIERPGFLRPADFDHLLAQPNLFLWNLLLWDIFKTKVLAKFQNQNLSKVHLQRL